MLPGADSIDVFEKLSSAKKNEIHAHGGWMKNILTEYHPFNKEIPRVPFEKHRFRLKQMCRATTIAISPIKSSRYVIS